ncbi:MAG: hypothetical protein ACI37Q_00250 [Candidatus Gastranaerophilaceae bacterium]
MEISRIEAISPKQIDWRKLTSKEIIKYDAQGVNVPPEYLQWAKEFINEVNANDKDETTYEMAHSANTTQQTTQEMPISQDSENSNTTDTTTEEPQKTAAQTKRENLENAGQSLRKQAIIFTKDSKNASKETIAASRYIEATKDKSDNEIEALESYMQALLAQAEATQNELKNEISKLNNEDNSSYSINKINQLNKQLQRYGNLAQTNISGKETMFNEFNSDILSTSGTILNAADFGSETALIGNELINSNNAGRFFFNYIIGRQAVVIGERTVNSAILSADLQSEGLDKNGQNLTKLQGYKTEVENKTGVAALSNSKKENENSKTNNNSENNSDKSQNTAQAASANLDKILQAKIRKGKAAAETPS